MTLDARPSSLTTRIQLTLCASKLPKGGTLRNVPPDTFARVSRLPSSASSNNNGGVVGPSLHHHHQHHHHHHHVGTTELIPKSCSPRWATVLVLEYEWGAPMSIYVEICGKKRTSGVATTEREEEQAGFKSLGGAVLEVSDILGSKHKSKAKRLPKGGCVYAHLEQRRQGHGGGADQADDCGSLALQLGALRLDYKLSNLQRVLTLASEPTTFFEISRQAQCASGSLWNVVYRSLPEVETSKPKWDRVELDLERLCNGDIDRALQVAVFCQQRKAPAGIMVMSRGAATTAAVEIGRLETNVRALLKKGQFGRNRDWHQAAFSLSRPENGENVGTIAVHEAAILPPAASSSAATAVSNLPSRLIPVPVPNDNGSLDESGEHDLWDHDSDEDSSTARLSVLSLGQIPPYHHNTDKPPAAAPPLTFRSYIAAGCSVELCVAIDFTSSNGDLRIPGTLHYHSDATLNDYEEAIHTIGSAVARYNQSQEFPVWGFGAKYGGQVRHIFQCGTRSTVPTVLDIYGAYRSVFGSDLIMSGPTVLVDVIKAAASRARKSHTNIRKELKYTVLLVLTDGIVSDLEWTKQTLLRVSELPLSVVVVGIGRADFTEMESVTQSFPHHRHNCTLVAFRDHQHDPRSLSRAALQSVPTQMVDYFVRNKVFPWTIR